MQLQPMRPPKDTWESLEEVEVKMALVVIRIIKAVLTVVENELEERKSKNENRLQEYNPPDDYYRNRDTDSDSIWK
ncbi:MAG: hypothetical protein HF312_02635 [Ignavibacteria bacterium]|nr:hypothetical protein [Ignavibacteria bacterium]